MNNIALQTVGLTKRFGALTAVDALTLDVFKGEVFGFLGPNGAGKTTAIRMMCGLMTPDAGHVTIQGQRMNRADSGIKQRIGVCPQEIVLWERLTCLEQLQFMGQMYGVNGRVARQRSEHLLTELGLWGKRGQQAHALSGGMQRRLNLAMALVHDPNIIILDEPEAGLDPQSRVKVRDYIQSLAQQKTIILTTHNMDEAERLADRVAIIDHGKLLRVDTPDALKQQTGQGDVIEIQLLQPLNEGDASPIENELSEIVSHCWIDFARSVVTVRALNGVALLPQILQTLTVAGCQPGNVKIRENSLEDVFIQLTGRKLRE
ncbi:MAG: ABC transporter ATP-binding protein [Chloroflexi bacterium]|nr:ABC transporter ATP-binding protein [Chloroflexota bacterium]